MGRLFSIIILLSMSAVTATADTLGSRTNPIDLATAPYSQLAALQEATTDFSVYGTSKWNLEYDSGLTPFAAKRAQREIAKDSAQYTSKFKEKYRTSGLYVILKFYPTMFHEYDFERQVYNLCYHSVLFKVWETLHGQYDGFAFKKENNSGFLNIKGPKGRCPGKTYSSENFAGARKVHSGFISGFGLPLKEDVAEKVYNMATPQRIGRDFGTLICELKESDRTRACRLVSAHYYLKGDDGYYRLSWANTRAAELVKVDSWPIMKFDNFAEEIHFGVRTQSLNSSTGQTANSQTALETLPKQSHSTPQSLILSTKQRTMLVQANLSRLKCVPGKIDGEMGRKTQRAFNRFLYVTDSSLKAGDILSDAAIQSLKDEKASVCGAAWLAQNAPKKLAGNWSGQLVCKHNGVATKISAYLVLNYVGKGQLSGSFTNTWKDKRGRKLKQIGSTSMAFNGAKIRGVSKSGRVQQSYTGTFSDDALLMKMRNSDCYGTVWK